MDGSCACATGFFGTNCRTATAAMIGAVSLQVSFAVNAAEVLDSATGRAAFEASFKADLATALNIRRSRIVIDTLAAGSLLVGFSIIPGYGSETSPTAALQIFTAMASDPGGAGTSLFSSPTFAAYSGHLVLAGAAVTPLSVPVGPVEEEEEGGSAAIVVVVVLLIVVLGVAGVAGGCWWVRRQGESGASGVWKPKGGGGSKEARADGGGGKRGDEKTAGLFGDDHPDDFIPSFGESENYYALGCNCFGKQDFIKSLGEFDKAIVHLCRAASLLHETITAPHQVKKRDLHGFLPASVLFSQLCAGNNDNNNDDVDDDDNSDTNWR